MLGDAIASKKYKRQLLLSLNIKLLISNNFARCTKRTVYFSVDYIWIQSVLKCTSPQYDPPGHPSHSEPCQGLGDWGGTPPEIKMVSNSVIQVQFNHSRTVSTALLLCVFKTFRVPMGIITVSRWNKLKILIPRFAHPWRERLYEKLLNATVLQT